MKKITSRSLGQAAADQIRELIRRGTLRTGERIVENQLCAKLGISRTPLREALRSLSSEGLVRLVPNRGAFVTQPSVAEIRELFEVMGILEGACACMAAEKLTDAGLGELERLHEDLERHYAARDHEAYIIANNLYHTFVQERARNGTLSAVINGLRAKIFLHRFRQLYVQDRFDRSIGEHRELLAAFRDRDAVRAEAVMKSHLSRQCDALVENLAPGENPEG
ncbi:MAG TPA: GntR family transcriptional regulator [Deferrisomatales bacterium]|nr:GntR family transcriptional regulator [Deferrisomatales bacterium]